MNICSHHHDEVCYSDSKCPVCVLMDDHERKLDELRDAIKEAERLLEDEKQLAIAYKKKWTETEAECQRLYKGQTDGER